MACAPWCQRQVRSKGGVEVLENADGDVEVLRRGPTRAQFIFWGSDVILHRLGANRISYPWPFAQQRGTSFSCCLRVKLIFELACKSQTLDLASLAQALAPEAAAPWEVQGQQQGRRLSW